MRSARTYLPKPRKTIFVPSAMRRLSSARPHGVDSSRTQSSESRGAVMVARVATFEGIDVEQAQKTMEEAEAIIRGLVEGLPGYEGALELATMDGKFVSVTFFDSEESAKAAEP